MLLRSILRRSLITVVTLSMYFGASRAAQAVLVRVDFAPSTAFISSPFGPGTEAAAISADAVFGSSGSNVWDVRSIPGYPAYSTPTFSGLLETSTGAATSVSISLDSVSSASNAPVTESLREDYLAINSGSVGYTISGLLPSTQAKLFLYTSLPDRDFDFTANGSLPVNVSGTGLLVTTTTDVSGEIVGTWSLPSGHSEADWAGFQLYQAPVPEPSAFVLASLGLLGLGFVTLRKKYHRA